MLPSSDNKTSKFIEDFISAASSAEKLSILNQAKKLSCAQRAKFYKSVSGGELGALHRDIGDVSQAVQNDKLTEEQRQNINGWLTMVVDLCEFGLEAEAVVIKRERELYIALVENAASITHEEKKDVKHITAAINQAFIDYY